MGELKWYLVSGEMHAVFEDCSVAAESEEEAVEMVESGDVAADLLLEYTTCVVAEVTLVQEEEPEE